MLIIYTLCNVCSFYITSQNSILNRCVFKNRENNGPAYIKGALISIFLNIQYFVSSSFLFPLSCVLLTEAYVRKPPIFKPSIPPPEQGLQLF